MIASRHIFLHLHAIKPVMNKMNMLVCSLGVICTVCIATANAGAIVVYPNMSRPGEKAEMVQKLERAKNLVDSVKQSIQQQTEGNKGNSTKLGNCTKEHANYVPMYRAQRLPKTVCDANGDYERMQCPMMWPRCFCVEPASGERLWLWGAAIAGDRNRPKRVDCGKRRVRKGACDEALARWNEPVLIGGPALPQCDANGYYKKRQCTMQGSWLMCWCVGAMTGRAVEGTRERVTRRGKGPDCGKEQLGKCAEALANSRITGSDYKPQCDENGDYKKMQCYHNPRSCFCVDALTGGRTRELGGEVPRRPFDVDCETRSESAARKTCAEVVANWDWKRPVPKPTCSANGDYERMQCPGEWPRCHCVQPLNGQRLWQWGAAVDGDDKRVDCGKLRVKKGECDEELARWDKPALGNGPPACDANGNYKRMQCNHSSCWCVDVTTGQRTNGTRNCGPDGKCAARLDWMRRTRPCCGHYVPACDDNGNFEIVQCNLGGGYFYCWCAQRHSGERIPGTAKWTKENTDEKNRAHCLLPYRYK